MTRRPLPRLKMTRELTAAGRTPADILAAMAALAMEVGGEGFSGRGHDTSLYGNNIVQAEAYYSTSHMAV